MGVILDNKRPIPDSPAYSFTLLYIIFITFNKVSKFDFIKFPVFIYLKY